MALTNQGVITANVNASTLALNTLGAVVNSGTLRAEGGACCRSPTATISNNGGLLQALAGSTVLLGNGGTLYDGTLASLGNGIVRQADNIVSRIGGVTIAAGSTVQVGNNAVLHLGKVNEASMITNLGDLRSNASGGFISDIRIDGSVTLAGAGTLTLQRDQATVRADGARTLTNNAVHTIQGFGQIGVGTALAVDNLGLINANVSGGNLVLNGTGTFTNTGTVQAQGGGTLVVGSTLIENAGGLLQALPGSTVSLSSGSTVYGGTLASSGGGLIVQSNNVGGSRIADVTIAAGSTVQAGNNAALFVSRQGVASTLTNHGEVRTNASGGFTSDLTLDGELTLAGTGTVTLQNAQARIRANVPRGAAAQRRAHPAGFWPDRRRLEPEPEQPGPDHRQRQHRHAVPQQHEQRHEQRHDAGRRGRLAAHHNQLVENAGGLIQALTGSTVQLDSNATIYGGTLASVDTGIIRQLDSLTSRIAGVTITGGSTVQAGNNANLFISVRTRRR